MLSSLLHEQIRAVALLKQLNLRPEERYSASISPIYGAAYGL